MWRRGHLGADLGIVHVLGVESFRIGHQLSVLLVGQTVDRISVREPRLVRLRMM